MSSDSERFALAARLYSALKRSSGRVIDVLWLLQNEPYAQEVIRLARAADAECADLAHRYEAMLRGAPAPKPVSNTPAAHTATGAFTATGSHYVRGLR
ncbi:MAG: hypothetical protein Q7J29_07490 [Stagnimonas sp.]|nr:hypothetical protein [Stagnimonas sp.]